MAHFNRPQFVIDCENEKRFIESHAQDYCKICPDRYRKLTTNLRCDCFFTGTKIDPNKRGFHSLDFYCILEGETLEPGWKEKDRKVRRSITREEVQKLYEMD